MSSPARADRKAARMEARGMDPELRRLGMVVILGTIMSILDVTIVIVAIDTLARDFHATLSTIQWVSTGYLLALSAVIPLSGWAVERFGAKRMWMFSLTMFTLGSALCGLAWNAPSLILFRVLQGLGGGMIMPIGMSILAKAAGPARIGRVMGTLGVPMLLGPVLGPVIGGVLVTHLSWRWCFYVNVPIGFVALYLARRVMAADTERHKAPLDVRGLALLSPGLALTVYGLSEAGTGSGFGSTRVLASIAVGLLLVAAFSVNALRVTAPLLDLRLFRISGFRMSSLTSLTVGAGMFGTMFILPLYYQVTRGASAM
ncbi:MAG TPA: DHA2 family efflux MFS transporter permease subunit, partial [Mycobacteriales bacterium]|nr:DHA2 family efflux MFS transporter permease subunit [Mycobacteriales bacterium]